MLWAALTINGVISSFILYQSWIEEVWLSYWRSQGSRAPLMQLMLLHEFLLYPCIEAKV